MNDKHLFQEWLTQAIKLSVKSTNQIECELGYPRNVLHNYRTGSELSATRLMELNWRNTPRAYFALGAHAL